MRLLHLGLASLICVAQAAEYALDPACDDTIAPGTRDGIVRGVQEAIDLAENALQVIAQHEDDPYVQNLITYLYGVDDRPQILARVTGQPDNIDVCSWFIKMAAAEGWPLIDRARIERVRPREFTDELREDERPVDKIKTLGFTMLHEASV
ncbi:hypothetical protein Micbo1qcDRAFT_203625 [Microdochium bolleyi]|uniref:Uncharacterized protein n=1 Tax=Microdochium bolleyi TaxID=196109 RepID=A0A136J8Q3_9PEZI|nr:hypothetical protein Micbo1qcDRAFT_203625 [Microdochium bolleyi]